MSKGWTPMHERVRTRAEAIVPLANGGPMCPACIASATLIAASAISTGGLAALALKLLHGTRSEQQVKGK